MADEVSIIGLKRGTVALVPHHAGWHGLFARECQRLRARLGRHALDIQHVGSTAVPGLVAKPVIDIAIAVASRDAIPVMRQPLIDLGYLDRGDQGADGGYYFVKERPGGTRTHHLHLVTIDDPQWGNYLRFRDILRAEPSVRTRYGELKLALQERFGQDRLGYTRAKEAFIRGVVQGA
jgi:GrpB-like predicted nucleotidyltransferase (UPF0157 family)